MARTVTAHLFNSVNGVVESPDQWQFDGGAKGTISVVGGIETIRSLFLAGVVDALTLTTHPVVGVGRRLFDETVPVTRLELVEGRTTSTGNALLTYRLRD